MIGIDLSLRSTGIVALDKNGEMLGFYLIRNTEKDYEVLLSKNANEIVKFISVFEGDIPLDVCLEGLSFGGLSGAKDVIQGNYWHLRIKMRQNKINLVDVVPVLRWRNNQLPKEVRDNAKKEKLNIKQVTADYLPEHINKQFTDYIIKNKLNKQAIFDLADAYFIAKYGMENTKCN